LLLLLVACGGDDAASGPQLDVTARFTVASVSGAGTSPLDALAGQTIDFHIVFDVVDFNAGNGNDPPGCKTRLYGFSPTAVTSQSALVQTEVIDRLDEGWSVDYQLCDSGDHTLAVDSAIDALNLNFGCGAVPAAAVRKDSTGSPVLSTFTATACNATILDVVNNRVAQASDFSVMIKTGPASLP
jgi:hypothetical protein